MDFWSFLPFLRGELGNLDFILHTGLLLIYGYTIVSNLNVLKRNKTPIDTIVIWTVITIFIGIIPSYIEYDQPVLDSIRACLRLTHGLFLYYVLRCWRYNAKRLMGIVTVISLVWVLLEIGQQFTYPSFWFSGRFFIYDKLDIRMGLYRYYIWGVDFVMMAYSYWLFKFFSGINKLNLNFSHAFFCSLILLAGLLCYVSRKHIYVALFVIVYYALRNKKSNKIITYTLTFLLFALLYTFFYESFNEMNMEAIGSQGEGEDFVRFIAAKYFLFDFSSSPLYPLWGVGLEAGGKLSSILKDLSYSWIYQADVGIIGYYSKFGLLGVSAIIMYIFYFFKSMSQISLWLHGFFIMKLILIIFDFWAIWDVGMCAYAVFLYFLYCDIKEKKLNHRFHRLS